MTINRKTDSRESTVTKKKWMKEDTSFVNNTLWIEFERKFAQNLVPWPGIYFLLERKLFARLWTVWILDESNCWSVKLSCYILNKIAGLSLFCGQFYKHRNGENSQKMRIFCETFSISSVKLKKFLTFSATYSHKFMAYSNPYSLFLRILWGVSLFIYSSLSFFLNMTLSSSLILTFLRNT